MGAFRAGPGHTAVDRRNTAHLGPRAGSGPPPLGEDLHTRAGAGVLLLSPAAQYHTAPPGTAC